MTGWWVVNYRSPLVNNPDKFDFCRRLSLAPMATLKTPSIAISRHKPSLSLFGHIFLHRTFFTENIFLPKFFFFRNSSFFYGKPFFCLKMSFFNIKPHKPVQPVDRKGGSNYFRAKQKGTRDNRIVHKTPRLPSQRNFRATKKSCAKYSQE